MEDEDGIWLVLLTAGMALLVIGLLLLEEAAWYVRYSALGGSLLLSLLAVYRGASGSASG